MYNSCNTYELNRGTDQTAKSIKISQLKSQLIQLEEDDKAYNELLQKYRQLQNEYQLVNEAKLHLEYELKQKNESTNKILSDLQCQNVDLTNELNEKDTIYQKLLADNKNLLRNLEERKQENENFLKTVAENDNMIKCLSQDKNQCEKDVCELDNTSKKNEEEIAALCHELECLKLKSKNQNDEINSKNIELNNNQKCLNELKNDNVNLNNQLNLKNASLEDLQNQLSIANKNIADLQNEISNLEQEHCHGKDNLEKLKMNFQNEHNRRIQAENDNVKLEGVLKDRDDTLNRLTCVNEALKSDREKLGNMKNKLQADVARYKNHIMILTEQTEKLMDELQRIINEDTEIYNLNLAQIQRLQKVINDNKKLLSEEFEALNALENYVRGQPSMVTNKNVVVTQTRKTYARQDAY
jgi:chromosome segregation ATPase